MEYRTSKIFTLQIKASLDEVRELSPGGGIEGNEFPYQFKVFLEFSFFFY